MIKKPAQQIAEKIVRDRYFKERELSEYACRSINGRRFYPDREVIPDKENIRSIFSHDTDRIIHSLAYSRYIDKTQVFYLIEHDHISHRVLHVQLVSKIARTIGRFLSLNEDLIEAISLGHDVGHTPFGHNGEYIINEFCEKNKAGAFNHNVQSFRLFHEIEKRGIGLNLSIQVLDGIICHNGEILNGEYKNDSKKDKNQLLIEYEKSLTDKEISKKIVPMTLEGCVMRISDVIAYIGRDIEDAITLKLIEREQLPKEISMVLGSTNSDIVNSLIIDILNNSYGKGAIIFSTEVIEALKELLKWNNKNIYSNPVKMVQDSKIKRMFNEILETNMKLLQEDKIESKVCKWARANGDKYLSSNSIARIVSDYTSGMTDDFVLKEYKDLVIPKSFGYAFKNRKGE